MASGGSGKSHQKKIEKFKNKHPEGRAAFSKKKKEAREAKRREVINRYNQKFLEKHPEGKKAYKAKLYQERREKRAEKKKKKKNEAS